MTWFLVAYFFIIQNSYFGWNAFPQSSEELICDGVFLVLLSIAAKP